MDIKEFLLERVAEDEELARDSYYEGQSWLPEEEAVVAGDQDLDYVFMMDRKRDAQHAAHWSPARVLRECAAKRAIITQAEAASEDRESVIQEFCVGMAESEAGYATDPGKLILETLAAVYSDHPDYRQEWSL